jgi:pyridoxine 5-phosphate synthase
LKARLGVNIDHVATLRQLRGEIYPSLENAAKIALDAGADQITIHLREDRRHIQDFDVPVVKAVCLAKKKLFNLEIGSAPEIVDIASKIKPDWVCLVPEKREERTTEGGLDLKNEQQFDRIASAIKVLREKTPETKISLFVEAHDLIIEKCLKLRADAVEIHTGDYAIAFNQKKEISDFLKRYEKSFKQIDGQMGFHAGHGLTNESLVPLVEMGKFTEYNIGHWIIAESVFFGLERIVKNLKDQL